MALFRKRATRTSRRALRKAHTKQLEAQAAAEKKFRAKQARSSGKDAAKDAARTARSEAKHAGGKAAAKAEATTESARELSAKEVKKSAKARRKSHKSSVRNYLGLATVLGPALAPIGYKVATEVRGRLDAARARKLGVAVEQLGQFTGHGAALSARIAGVEDALNELVAEKPTEQGYRDEVVTRLGELSTAVHAAERMPTPRRKGAHHAIGSDLDKIDAELLAHLGVR